WPDGGMRIFTYSQGGGPATHIPPGPPSISAGSSEGNIMLFFQRDELGRDYSTIRAVTTLLHGLPHTLPGGADKPSICNGAYEYLGSDGADPDECALRPREIPPLRETIIPARRLAATGRVRWLRDPLDWFEFRIPGAFEIEMDDRRPTLRQAQGRPNDDSGTSTADALEFRGVLGNDAIVLTFEFAEQIVGWPMFTIHAPAGTVVELMTQEAHDPAGPPWLDTHFFAWSRFVCR
ncbi:hypothetical protein SE17_40990, partial [Kouleothrix aurantiaca]